jgi:hypothetical protein
MSARLIGRGGEECMDQRGKLRRRERAPMASGHTREAPGGQQRGQFIGVRALVPVADHDERRGRDQAQVVLGRGDERAKQAQQRPGVGAELRGPVRYLGLGRAGGQGDPVGERGERAAVRASPLRAGDLREPLPGHDGAAGRGAAREQAHHDPAAERVAPEVVLARAEPEVPDQGERVVGEHVGRVSGQIVRSRALPMTAEVGQDEAESRLRERVARALVKPVRSRAHEAVQQDQRPARPGLAVREPHAVIAGELENVHSVHDPRRDGDQ